MEFIMSSKKVIAVVGATGAQGGGLVRAILADPNGGFSARAITRNVDSDKARALARAGAEVRRAVGQVLRQHLEQRRRHE